MMGSEMAWGVQFYTKLMNASQDDAPLPEPAHAAIIAPVTGSTGKGSGRPPSGRHRDLRRSHLISRFDLREFRCVISASTSPECRACCFASPFHASARLIYMSKILYWRYTAFISMLCCCRSGSDRKLDDSSESEDEDSTFGDVEETVRVNPTTT